MPIKSLESFLFERKLVSTLSIDLLRNATVGIDVEHYLSRIYTFKKEQFLLAVGGIPSSLTDYLSSDLQVFREYNIKPVFLVSGLNIQLQAHDYETNEFSLLEAHLAATWNKLTTRSANNPYAYNSPNNDSFRLFTDPLPVRPMVRDLIRYFIDNGIDYLVSPYDASFQLLYLHRAGIIDVVYGSTDMLVTSIDRFILGMEFQLQDFRFVDKNKVLAELNLTERQFMDLAVMVGCSVQPLTFPNFPPLPKPNPIQPFPQLSYFKLGLDIVYQYLSFNGNSAADLYGYILSLNDPQITDLYLQGHFALKFLPVLTTEGSVGLYTQELAKMGFENPADLLTVENASDALPTVKVPNNVHEIVSQRLPPELYFYQLVGLLPIELLEAITRGRLNIRPPLEGGISISYKKLITSEKYLRSLDLQFNVLTQLLARYFQVKKVQVVYWFKDEVIELNNRLTPPFFQQMGHLYSSGGKDSFELGRFLGGLKQNYSKTEVPKELTRNDDIISTVLLRTLFLLGLIDNKTGEVSSAGVALKKFVAKHGDGLTEKNLQLLAVLLLLLQTQAVKLNEFSKEFLHVPRYAKEFPSEQDISLTPDELNKIALISRVFSLLKFNILPINYMGPISRSLLNFRSQLKHVQSQLINSLQVVLVDFIVRQDKNNLKANYADKDSWYTLIKQLPWYEDLNNTLLGVVAEIWFEYALRLKKAQTKLSKEEVTQRTKDHLLNLVYQIGNALYNINVSGINSVKEAQMMEDLKLGVEFWDLFVKLAKVANEEDKKLVSDVFLGEVEDTDVWMKEYF